jgi:hypothetical protein
MPSSAVEQRMHACTIWWEGVLCYHRICLDCIMQCSWLLLLAHREGLAGNHLHVPTKDCRSATQRSGNDSWQVSHLLAQGLCVQQPVVTVTLFDLHMQLWYYLLPEREEDLAAYSSSVGPCPRSATGVSVAVAGLAGSATCCRQSRSGCRPPAEALRGYAGLQLWPPGPAYDY